MGQDIAFQKRIQRIGEIVEQLSISADPNTSAMTRELLESMMALHSSGLERMLEIAHETDEAGKVIIEKCGRDPLVSSLLILYGLHPEDLQSRVINAVESLGDYLHSHGAHVEITSNGDDGNVALRVHIRTGGCSSTAAGVKSSVEVALQEAAPDARSVIVELTGDSETQSGFVPLAELQNAPSLEVVQGSAD
jgi:Fe-S cluster biogenesis protein NfuA